MTDEMQLMLLQILNANGKVLNLRNWGEDLSDLAIVMSQFRKDKLIESRENRLTLTEKGKDKLLSLATKLKRTGINIYISPLFNEKTDKIGIDDIYLPDMSKKLEI